MEELKTNAPWHPWELGRSGHYSKRELPQCVRNKLQQPLEITILYTCWEVKTDNHLFKVELFKQIRTT
jgi:hypothetical protein